MPSDENCANPLFLGWVKEWWDTARERNTKGVYAYKKAYGSLKSCPMTFQHPAELIKLKNFGPNLVSRLTEKLKQHCEDNGLSMPPHPQRKRQREVENALAEADAGQAEQPPTPKRARKAKPYVPKLNSGAYALLMALSELGPRESMDKATLILKAQPFSEFSFTVPSMANKSYTAWDSMKTLDDKELVYIRGRPTKRYSLTDEGWEVVKRMREARNAVDGVGGGRERASTSGTAIASGSGSGTPTANRIENINPRGSLLGSSEVKRQSRYTALNLEPYVSPSKPPPQPRPPQPRPSRPAISQSVINLDSDEEEEEDDFVLVDEEQDRKPIIKETNNHEWIDLVADGDTIPVDESSLPKFDPIRFDPGSFTVELVLDTREIQAKNNRDHIPEELTKLGVRPIMRSLELGDVLWIAKLKQPAGQGIEGDEVILDYIVERKRLDDLISSIKDGRLREQKYRLKRSGMKNVIYLIEEFSVDKDIREHYQDSINSTIVGLQAINGVFVKKTENIARSIEYLANITKMLKKMYESKPLYVIPTNVLTAKNYLPLLKHLREKEPTKGHYISYPAFASLVSKSDMLTLRDVFIKMLMCIRRLSGEKAIEIQKVWKTPNQFFHAFERCGADDGGQRKQKAMVADALAHLVDRRCVDKGLSEKLADVWGLV